MARACTWWAAPPATRRPTGSQNFKLVNGIPEYDNCINSTGALCAGTSPEMANSATVAVSPDNNSVYVANFDSHSITVFNRAANGQLNQDGLAAADKCFKRTAGFGCTVAPLLLNPRDIEVTPDGKNVLVADSGYDGSTASLNLLEFDRAGATKLTQHVVGTGCVSFINFSRCKVRPILLRAPADQRSRPTAAGSIVAQNSRPRGFRRLRRPRGRPRSGHGRIDGRTRRGASSGTESALAAVRAANTHQVDQPHFRCRALPERRRPLHRVARRASASACSTSRPAVRPPCRSRARSAAWPAPRSRMAAGVSSSNRVTPSSTCIPSPDGRQRVRHGAGAHLLASRWITRPCASNMTAEHRVQHGRHDQARLRRCRRRPADLREAQRARQGPVRRAAGGRNDHLRAARRLDRGDSFTFSAIAAGVTADTATVTVNVVARPVAAGPALPAQWDRQRQGRVLRRPGLQRRQRRDPARRARDQGQPHRRELRRARRAVPDADVGRRAQLGRSRRTRRASR